MHTDIRHAIRTLARAPGFSLVVVLTLGLGIGANTAIFSLMDHLLLRLLPVERPEELVQLDGPGPFSGRTMNDRTFSYPMYRDLRDGNDGFAGLVARASFGSALVHRAQAERVTVELVSGNTFEVLDVRPALGRAFTPEDDRVPAGHPVTILSHAFWTRRFAADPGVLHAVVTVNTTPMTVIGVAPTWDDLDNRRSRWVNIVGRLKPGLTADEARARPDVLYKQINAGELESEPGLAAASDLFSARSRAR